MDYKSFLLSNHFFRHITNRDFLLINVKENMHDICAKKYFLPVSLSLSLFFILSVFR